MVFNTRKFFLCICLMVAASPMWAAPPNSRTETYPYGGASFNAFVRDSYRLAPAGESDAFYRWMEDAYLRYSDLFPGEPAASVTERLTAEARRLATVRDISTRTAAEALIAEQLHRAIKTAIPKFSLERGYEFRNTVALGERQCLLQSVLVSGLMQRMGMDAGTYMVWKSENGTESNNGHVVSVLKLPDGTDVLVDCSEPHAMARQQGLFVYDSVARRYRFVTPEYRQGTAMIEGYRVYGSTTVLQNRQVRPLDTAFLQSQFDFYRGEHTPGGLLHLPRTASGLEQEVQHLRRAVHKSPQNPLPMYMLGRAYLKQNKLGAARSCLTRAHALYARAGRVPPGAKAAMSDLQTALRKSSVMRRGA